MQPDASDRVRMCVCCFVAVVVSSSNFVLLVVVLFRLFWVFSGFAVFQMLYGLDDYMFQ